MKKKLLFMIISMNVGGTEKALLNMINQMSNEKFDITILMLEESGGFLNQIPANVQIQYVNEYKHLKSKLNMPPKTVAKKMVKEGRMTEGLILLFVYVFSKLTRNKNHYYRYVTRTISKIKTEYDIAVAYAGPMDFISFFVVHKIKAKRKIQWIHFDVEKIHFDSSYAKKIYRNFEAIKVVSEEAQRKLIKAVPSVKDKTSVFLNVCSPKQILKQSKDGIGFKDNYTGVRILTVGRLSHEKGQDLAIKVLARLIREGHNLRWYCLGDGNARNEYERLITLYNLEEHFFLLGSDPNPYPYMDQCDLYVQPSRHEGYCITLTEAKCFNKPIITTNFTGASEQIIHAHTGLIVNVDEVQIYIGVKQLVEDEYLRKKLSKNLKEENNSTTNGKISII